MLSVWCCLVFFYWPAIDLLTVCLLPGEFLQAALSMMDPMGKTDMAWKKHLKPFLKTRVMPPLGATELCENDLFCGGFTFEVLLHLISFDLFISFIFWCLSKFLMLIIPGFCTASSPPGTTALEEEKTPPSLNCLHQIAIFMFGLISDLFLSLRFKSGNRRHGGSRLLVMDFLHDQQVRHKY